MTCLRPGALCKWSGRLQTAGRKGFSYGDYLSRRRGETGRLQKAAIEAKQVSDEKLHRGAPDEADDGHAIVTEIADQRRDPSHSLARAAAGEGCGARRVHEGERPAAADRGARRSREIRLRLHPGRGLASFSGCSPRSVAKMSATTTLKRRKRGRWKNIWSKTHSTRPRRCGPWGIRTMGS
jgi:hypothetical protein